MPLGFVEGPELDGEMGVGQLWIAKISSQNELAYD